MSDTSWCSSRVGLPQVCPRCVEVAGVVRSSLSSGTFSCFLPPRFLSVSSCPAPVVHPGALPNDRERGCLPFARPSLLLLHCVSEHTVSLGTELVHLRSLLIAFFLELKWLYSGFSIFSWACRARFLHMSHLTRRRSRRVYRVIEKLHAERTAQVDPAGSHELFDRNTIVVGVRCLRFSGVRKSCLTVSCRQGHDHAPRKRRSHD